MNLADAVYRTVHEYPGGATALAARMGMSSNMLSNKVNPNNDTHHLRLDEANTLMSFTNDYRILHAQAETHSKVCIHLPECLEKKELDKFEMLLEVGARNGDMFDLIKKSRLDGTCPKNLSNIRHGIYELQKTLTSMSKQIKQADKEKA